MCQVWTGVMTCPSFVKCYTGWEADQKKVGVSVCNVEKAEIVGRFFLGRIWCILFSQLKFFLDKIAQKSWRTTDWQGHIFTEINLLLHYNVNILNRNLMLLSGGWFFQCISPSTDIYFSNSDKNLVSVRSFLVVCPSQNWAQSFLSGRCYGTAGSFLRKWWWTKHWMKILLHQKSPLKSHSLNSAKNSFAAYTIDILLLHRWILQISFLLDLD